MEKNLIDESKGIGSSMFQNFWLGFMFTFLWLLVGFSVIFLTPTHAKIMASNGRILNWLLINALSLYEPIFIGTILCLLLMGISKIRIIKNSSTGKRRLALNRSADMWRKILMSVLILAVIYLTIGLFTAWVEATVSSVP